jgi:HPt (histidine-containing phosphotransfer) domain-containing protein
LEKKNTMSRIDLSLLFQLSAGNVEFVESIVSKFLELEEGARIDLNEAVLNTNLEAIREVMHKLKPNLKFIGARDLYLRCVEIESQCEGDKNNSNQICGEVHRYIADLVQLRNELNTMKLP